MDENLEGQGQKVRIKFDDSIKSVKEKIEEVIGKNQPYNMFEVNRLRNGYC